MHDLNSTESRLIWVYTIGIIGGLGPHAHLDLERLILEEACRRLPISDDQGFPSWVLSSVPETPDRTAFLLGRGPSPVPHLNRSLLSLQSISGNGADFALIACNTAHAYLCDGDQELGLPIVNAVEETVMLTREAYGAGARIGILATDGTLEAGLYQDELRRVGQVPLTLWDLSTGEDTGTLQRDLVMQPIYGWPEESKPGIKVAGFNAASSPHITEPLEKAVRLLAQAGSSAVILGCTELPLALREASGAWAIPTVDPMMVAARIALDIASGARPLPTVRRFSEPRLKGFAQTK